MSVPTCAHSFTEHRSTTTTVAALRRPVFRTHSPPRGYLDVQFPSRF